MVSAPFWESTLDLAFPYLEIARQLGIPFYGHAHGYDVSLRLREPEWREKYLRYNDAAGVITMSEASKARLVEMGLEAGKVHVVPYGVDVPEQPVLRPAQSIVRCVAVGRMAAKKAPILTLDAFRRAGGGVSTASAPGLRPAAALCFLPPGSSCRRSGWSSG